MCEQRENIKITVEDGDGRIMITTVNWDANIWQYVETFRAILYWLTFQPKSIDRALPNEDMQDTCCGKCSDFENTAGDLVDEQEDCELD
jgi:hypothetical protein